MDLDEGSAVPAADVEEAIVEAGVGWFDWFDPFSRFCRPTFGCDRGCRVSNSRVTNSAVNRSPLESGAIECDSHVDENGLNSNEIGAIAWWRCRYGVVGSSRRCTRTSTELQSCYLAEAFWNVAPQRVRVPYAKGMQPLS
jgi:hypothetical protein